MYFYRHPGWGIGFKILMIVLLIAGGTFVARSSFQAGFLQGTVVEGGEFTTPMFYPHQKGMIFHPMGGSFFSVVALFFGGILLIKLITSIIGLVMFKRWKTEGGPEWEDWKYSKFRPHPHHCGPYYRGHWGPTPYPPQAKAAEDESPAESAEGEEAS